MTRNFKVLSLLVLTSITLGALAARERRSNCDCDTTERKFCKDKCCNTTDCQKNCATEQPILAFDVCLSFEQVVDNTGNPRPSTGPNSEKPGGICGRFKICFAQDFSSASYELKIFGDSLTGNVEPFGAVLGLGDPNDQVTGNEIISLSGLNKDGNGGDCTPPTNLQCKTQSTEFCCRGDITNDTLKNNPRSIFTVAELYYQIFVQKRVFVSVNGNNCFPGNQYGRNTGGLLRSQLGGPLRCQTGC